MDKEKKDVVKQEVSIPAPDQLYLVGYRSVLDRVHYLGVFVSLDKAESLLRSMFISEDRAFFSHISFYH